tara:strand:+ start:353 stop:1132 length:780 start_codon:yes stop_codon:yes gene_type:complete
MKVKVTKVNGNNNNFVLLLKKDIPKNLLLNTEIIKKLCSSNTLVDGLLILDYKNSNQANLDYYNNDGTWETLCVNGIRCAALLIKKIYNKNNLIISCGDGKHKTKIIDKSISVSMPEPKYVMEKIRIESLEGYYINSGAKHFITEIIADWPKYDQLVSIAKNIRFNTKYFPDGVNVNFFKQIDNNIVKIITYEKGIENIVESCASGSYACAYHISKKTTNKKFTVINDGGNLNIQFDSNYKKNSITAKAIIEEQLIIEI